MLLIIYTTIYLNSNVYYIIAPPPPVHKYVINPYHYKASETISAIEQRRIVLIVWNRFSTVNLWWSHVPMTTLARPVIIMLTYVICCVSELEFSRIQVP